MIDNKTTSVRNHRLPHRHEGYSRYVKRSLDIGISLCILILLMPLLLLLSLLLLIFQGGNPFFLQTRIGKDNKPFRIFKFRTMNDKRDENGELLSDPERTTCIGRLLRNSSLDELPEFFNILIGHMSIIGPRPWIPEQMNYFDARARARRMQVRPGLTGFAQIQGRNNISFRQRVAYDLSYIRHESFRLDLQIFLYTFLKVAKQEGIYNQENVLGKQLHASGIEPKDPSTRGMRGNRTRYNNRQEP